MSKKALLCRAMQFRRGLSDAFIAYWRYMTWSFERSTARGRPLRPNIGLHNRTFFDIRARKLCTAPHNRAFFTSRAPLHRIETQREAEGLGREAVRCQEAEIPQRERRCNRDVQKREDKPPPPASEAMRPRPASGSPQALLGRGSARGRCVAAIPQRERGCNRGAQKREDKPQRTAPGPSPARTEPDKAKGPPQRDGPSTSLM